MISVIYVTLKLSSGVLKEFIFILKKAYNQDAFIIKELDISDDQVFTLDGKTDVEAGLDPSTIVIQWINDRYSDFQILDMQTMKF